MDVLKRTKLSAILWIINTCPVFRCAGITGMSWCSSGRCGMDDRQAVVDLAAESDQAAVACHGGLGLIAQEV